MLKDDNVMQYDSLFSVSKAIAEKMGADSTKKYDSTYSVALEILNRMGSAGGGDASTLESVDVLPTSGVKDGDVVYLKGNAEKADGFYVATLGGDGSATWTPISGGGSSIKTYVFQALADNGTAGVSETDRAAILQDVKNGEMIRINVLNSGYSFLAIGTYYTETRAEVNFGFAVRSNQYYKYDTSTDIVQFIGVDDMRNDIDGLNEQITNLITRTQEIDGKIGVIATDTLPTVENAGDKLYAHRDEDKNIKLYGKVFTDEVSQTPLPTNKYFRAFNIQLADDEWTNYYNGGGNKVSLTINFLKLTHPQFNIDFTVAKDASDNTSIVPSLRNNDNFRLGENVNGTYELHNTEVGEDMVVAYVTVDVDTKSFHFEMSETDYPMMLKEKSQQTIVIGGNSSQLSLNLSKGFYKLSKPFIKQAIPYLDTDGNIIEGGQKLSEKYNPFHRTKASSESFNFVEWNEFGQITEGHSLYQKRIWINKSKSTDSWGYLYGDYLYEIPDLMVVPTVFGTSGQVLQSAGEGNAPTWTDMIKIQKITQDAYDALQTKDDNVLYVITD